MPDDNRPIEERVVRISPDLTGFARKLRTDLRRETAGVAAAVRVEADCRGVQKSIRKCLDGVNVEYKVKVEADCRNLQRSVRNCLRETQLRALTNNDKLTVKIDVDERSALGAAEKAGRLHKRIRNAQEQEEAAEIQASLADRYNRTRTWQDKIDQAHAQALAEQTRREKLEQIRQTRQAELSERDRQRRLAGIRRTVTAERWGPQLIDVGGRGIRPMNALYGAALALSPALFAVGASALQASTSIAALGAAGFGAVLGVTAVTMALGRISDAVKLREQVRMAQIRGAATSAAAERSNADAIRNAAERVEDARRGVQRANADLARSERDVRLAVADARQARAELTQAYIDERRAIAELREEVSDLALEESGAALGVEAARERLAAVERNYWASPLERAQALQDLREAEERLSDTQRERGEKSKELADRERKGIDQSERVRDARRRVQDADQRIIVQQEQLADAHLRVADAQRDVARAQADLARARNPAGGARGGAGDAAAAELAALRAQMSPAARALDDWLAANQGLLDGMRRQMESAVLPGFLDFLRQVTRRGPRTASTLDIIAGQAADLGAIIGDTAGRFGELTRQPFFRRALATVGRTNARSFQLMSDAALILVKPLTQIVEAAAPLGVRFAGALRDAATAFAGFIDRAERSGALTDWFDRAGDAFARWVDLGKAILRIVMPIFREALPTGNNLVERLTAFLNEIGDRANSTSGMAAIASFFDKFRTLRYGDIAQMLGQLATTLAAIKAVRFAANHPFFAAFTLLATIDPAATAGALSMVTGFVTKTLGMIQANPAAAATLLAIFGGIGAANKVVDIGVKLPGVDNLRKWLTSKFKWLGGTQTSTTMTVHAGIVNILGGAGGAAPGRPGRPGLPGAAGGAAAGGVAARGVLAAAGPVGAVVGAAIAAYEIGTRAHDTGRAGTSPIATLEAALRAPSWGTIATAYVNLNPFGYVVNTISMIVEHGFRGWVDKSVAQANAFRTSIIAKLEPVLDWFRTLPGKVWDFVKTLPGRLAEWAGNLVGFIIVALVRGVPALFDFIVGMNVKILGFFTDVGKKILDWAFNLPTQIATNLATLPSKVETAIMDLPAVFSRIWDTIKRNLASGAKTAVDLLNRFLGGVHDVTSKFGVDVPLVTFTMPTDPVYRGLADGGRVAGFSPHPRADNVPAMLTAGEYVHPVDTVQHYGAGFMDRLRRKEVPRYAFGGLVGDLTAPRTGMPLFDDLVSGMFDRIRGGFGNLVDRVTGWFGGGAGGGTATGDADVARIAEATARAMGATTKQLVALMEAGLVESGMRNLDYGDRDSLGFLQQRPSQGWGTPAQIMDVAYATRSFITRAKARDRAGQTPGQLAQAVQISAFPERYDQREADAVAWINREAPYMPDFVPTPGGPVGGGDRVALVAFGRWLQAKGYSVSEHPAFGGVDPVHSDGSWHYKAGAIDVNAGAGTSRREQALLRQIVPEGHRRGLRSIFMHPTLGHFDHAHFDIGARQYDSGGILPPGATVAVNNTGRNEYVSTNPPAESMRIDRRDLAALAQMLATAVAGQQVVIDGRRIGEIVHGYDYLPRGI